MKMKCCYSNQFVKDWSKILKVRETKAIQFSRRQNRSGVGREFWAKMIEVKVAEINAVLN